MKVVATVSLILQWREKYDVNTARPERFSSSDLTCVSYYSASFQLSKCFCATLVAYFLWRRKQGIEGRKETNEVREEKRKKNDVVAYCCYPAPLLNQHPSSFSSPICGESLIEFLVLRSPSSIRFYSLFFQAKEPSKKRPNIGREDAEDIASPTAGCVGWKLGYNFNE